MGRRRSWRAALFLFPVLSNVSCLPLTNFAAGPRDNARVLNDIVVNEKRRIVDIARRVSTELMAGLLTTPPPNSMAQDKDWQGTVCAILQRTGAGRASLSSPRPGPRR